LSRSTKLVSELDKVVQKNAAAAEEAAAAAEELNAQAFPDARLRCPTTPYCRCERFSKELQQQQQSRTTKALASIKKIAPISKTTPAPKKADLKPPAETKGKEVSPDSVIPLDEDF
jgi:methyl-accepting chemotaxis protein